MPHTVYRTFQFLIGVDGVMSDKILIALHGGKRMVPAVFRVLSLSNQPTEHSTLQGLSPTLVLLQFPLTGLEHFPDYTSNTHLLSA